MLWFFYIIGNIDAFGEPVLTTKNAGKAYRRNYGYGKQHIPKNVQKTNYSFRK